VCGLMSGPPYIFTFYSYKGGVGRSLALLNVAYALVGRGRHVLMVDFDLEAPGITNFLERNGELEPAASGDKSDILDLLEYTMKSARAACSDAPGSPDIPPIGGFARSVLASKLSPLAPKLGDLGRLDVVGADTGRDYWGRLNSLELPQYGQNVLLRASAELWRYFKNQRFPFKPLGLEKEPPEDTPYDYVLVDSRTGITETGGLCIGPLADRLVVITGLNDQNVRGTKELLELAGIEPRARSKDSKPWDDADDVSNEESSSRSLGPKPTIIVASPLPAGEIATTKERLGEIEKCLGPVATTLSYHPQLALLETVFVREHPTEHLASEYAKLTDHIMALAEDLGKQILPKTISAMNSGDVTTVMRGALRLAPLDRGDYPTLLKLIRNKLEPWASSDVHLMNRFFTLAERALGSSRAKVLEDWGIALSEQAKTKSGTDADRLFAESYEKFAQALELEPGFYEALNIWGFVLSEQAKTKSGTDADPLFAESYEKFARALELKPDYHEALNNCGVALSEQAKTKSDEEADRLFAESHEMYNRALELEPGFHEALGNWGITLSEQAKTKSGEDADRLFAKSYEKYSDAIELRPDFHQAIHNWGAALSEQAKTKSGAEAARLFDDATTLLEQAEAIAPGSAWFNLACLSALRGQVTASILILRRAKESGQEVHRSRIEGDSDFAGVLEHPEMQRFLAELESPE